MKHKEHIRTARAFLEISIKDLSKLTKVSYNSLNKIEKGSGSISNAKIETINAIQESFEERGIIFKLTDKGFPYIEYDPDKDVVGYLKKKKEGK